MKVKKKLLCLPVELYKREMLPKLYLALKAADKDFQVLIGYYNDPAFEQTKDGFYFYKDHATCSLTRFLHQKNNHMLMGALDEEGLIYDQDIYARTRGCKSLLDTLDCVFVWGVNQAKTINKISEIQRNKYIAGSPKFDFYKLLKSSNSNKKNTSNKVKNILINTRFTYVNGLRDGKEIDVLRSLGFVKTKEDEINFNLFLEDDRKIFTEFDSLIKKLAIDKEFDVVIRPHPAEILSFYKIYEELSANIIVDNDSNMTEQILNCDVMIHDGCSTAIEARAMGKPVIGLRPEALVKPYTDFANHYSFNFSSADKLYDVLKVEPLSYFIEIQPDVSLMAQKNIQNWSDDLNASDLIVDTISRLDIPKQNMFTKKNLVHDIRWFIRWLAYTLTRKSNLFTKILSGIYSVDKVDCFKNNYYVEAVKFPPLGIFEIENNIDYITELDVSLGRKIDYTVQRVSRQSWLIYKH